MTNELIVSAAWLRTHQAEPHLQIIDTRSADAYLAGHIPGARHADLAALPLRSSAPAAIDRFNRQLETLLRHLGIRPGDRVVFYEDFSGTSAARGVWLMDYAGLGGGALLDGGLSAWVELGGGLTSTPTSALPSELTITPNPDTLATADAIQAAIDRTGPALTLLDTRNAFERRAGAIPGAHHLDWLTHLNPDGTLRPLAELAERYTELGLHPDQDIATYCGSGFRAAHTYLILRALGYERVRNYAPSWGEWGRLVTE